MINRKLYNTSYMYQDKRFILLFIVACIFILIWGCKKLNDCPNVPICQALDDIESQMLQYPENLDSLLNKIDTTNFTPHEQARIRTIRGLIQNDKGEFDVCIRELEKAETVFINHKDDYHRYISKLIRAFAFEYLKLNSNASDLFVECDGYFERKHLEKFRFYSSLGILRMSKHLLLDEKVLIDRIKKDAEQFKDPHYEGLLYATVGLTEKNDSLSNINYERARIYLTNANRWSRVYTLELNMLFKKLKQNPTEATQLYYNNFPNKNFRYTPNVQQRIRYKYGQAYLFALQGKNLKAIEVANRVLNEAVESNMHKEESDCVNLLANLYMRISDFKNAYYMLERYNLLKEQTMNELQKNRLLALGAHYRYAELEREKLDLKVKVQKSLLTLSAVSLVFIVIFAVGWFLFKESRHKQEILKLKNIEIEDQIKNLLLSLDKHVYRNADLISQVENLKVQYNDSSKISEFLQAIEKKQITSWLEYESIFMSLRPGWIEGLKQQKKFGLSVTDLRYCMCFYFNLSNKNITELLKVSPDAIKSAKKRIRDKFSLDEASEIYLFLKSFE